MNIFDISWPISKETTAYKDKKVINFEHTKIFAEAKVRESVITLGSHSGTHIDAPAHFMRGGKTIDQLPLTNFIGHCKVIDLTHVTESVTHDILAEKNEEISIDFNDIILLKTKNSKLSAIDTFDREFVYLHHSGARYLTEQKIKTVGIDYLGIERNQPDHDTHLELMKNNTTIIEGLRLGCVDQGVYTLYCLPLCMIGLEAAPARALLIKE